MWKEFQEFIDRGNVVDLAVGVMMGSATTAVVNALVDDVLSPIIGVFLGGVDFAGLSITIGDAQIMYGSFLNALGSFFVIAFVLFLIVRGINRMHFNRDKKAEDEPKTPSEVEVLQDILAELKAR